MIRFKLDNPRERARASYAIIHAPAGSIVTITPPEESDEASDKYPQSDLDG